MRQKSLLYIGNKLSKKGNTVTSIETLGSFLKQEGYLVYTASSVHNKFFRLLDMIWTTIKYSRKVSYVLIDTYSTQNFYYAVTVGNLCRLLRLPYIPILRGGDLPRRLKTNKFLSYKLFNGAKTNVAPSLYLLDTFRAEDYSNLLYIPNSIEIDNYQFSHRTEIRPKLLWVRSFAKIYNPQLALKVLETLNDKGYDASLCMVGPEKDGTLKYCKKIANEKALNVTFTGMLDKAGWAKLSIAYDIFINTTNFDNTPISVIEAMALGLPVVSTNVGGVPYLIDDQKDGLLVPPDDPQQFVEAIIMLLSDGDLGAELSKKARTKVEDFDWQKVKT